MASYRNPVLRDKLAAEYVVGTLRGRARARFDSLLRYDGDLRRLVAEWEARLTPLSAAAGEIAPPSRVWHDVSRRIGAAAPATGWWSRLAFWRVLALTSTALVLALGTIIGMAPRAEPPMAMVAVMNDEKGQPALVVSWPPMKAARAPHIRIKVVQEHPVMAPGTAWEMWMLPGAKAAPVSLGLINIDRDQVMKVSPELAAKMSGAWGLAMSVEPEGGSRTGAPSGPVIFKGQCVRML